MATDNPLFCPSCGKENPAEATVCRFCAASLVERISLKIVPVGIALLLLVAAVHFHLATSYEPDYADITTLTAERNFDRVRVRGRVANVQVVREDYGHHQVRIELQGDEAVSRFGDNRISVRLEGEPAEDFLAHDDPVRRGDLVDVAAVLYAGEGYRHLSLSGLPFIRVLERGDAAAVAKFAGEDEAEAGTPAPRTTVAELLAAPEKFRDRLVIARPLEVAEVPAGLPFFRARDPGTEKPDLVVIGWKGTPPKPGDRISVRGKFIYYEKGKYWEIQLRDGDRGALIGLDDKASE